MSDQDLGGQGDRGDRGNRGSDSSSSRGGPAQPSLRRALALRRTRTQVLVGTLFCLLGFVAAVQVGANRGGVDLGQTDTTDLVRILDDVNQRESRLQDQLRELEILRDRLASGADADKVALDETRARISELSILTGVVPVVGPGVVVRLVDPQDAVDATLMLDTVQELRDAGAEAIQVGDQRVVVSTWFADPPNNEPGVVVDGVVVSPPLEITAIGDPRTLSAALRIPGGVVDSLRTLGGDALITERDQVTITALHAVPSPQYAQPASP